MKLIGLVPLLVLAACSASGAGAVTTAPAGSVTTSSIQQGTAEGTAPAAPRVPNGELEDDVAEAVGRLLDDVFTTGWEVSAVDDLAAGDDPRVAWLLADLMRFYQSGPPRDELVSAFVELTGAAWEPGQVDFVWAMNHLISWDLPAWDGYAAAKARIYQLVEPRWRAFFDDDESVDWRFVTWGGVLADARPLDDNGPCNCIPALDHPKTTDAAGGDWYDDDAIVFGVVVGDEAIALPKNQMEIHEMVNLTLGGRELGIPYCTLCGSAQAYYVDDVAGVERVVLRTSGLLARSNKLMYDLTTGSAIDTFTGKALTGPLAAADVTLEQVTVVAATWEDWRAAHPDTLILAEDGGIGRQYPTDPLGGRDDRGPIFPVGDIDDRLPIQEAVIGVITPEGQAIAFPVAATRAALETTDIEFEGVTVRLIDGIRVFDESGRELTTHQAFWFAWSQFHEGTIVWDPFGS